MNLDSNFAKLFNNSTSKGTGAVGAMTEAGVV
jgi:hypothetical protein